MVSKMIGKGGERLVRVPLHKSLEHVHTSAAPFLRHLLVPSSQHPRSSTTEKKEMKMLIFPEIPALVDAL